MENFDYEMVVMELIMNAGQCKSLSFMALTEAKQGNFEKAESLIAEANEAAKKAHDVQTSLIGYDEGEGKLPIVLVMVHAQDHLMTAMLAKELINELIEIHKKLN